MMLYNIVYILLLMSRHHWPSSYRYRRLIGRLRGSFEHIIAPFYRDALLSQTDLTDSL